MQGVVKNIKILGIKLKYSRQRAIQVTTHSFSRELNTRRIIKRSENHAYSNNLTVSGNLE
jgi:hypothetical protein